MAGASAAQESGFGLVLDVVQVREDESAQLEGVRVVPQLLRPAPTPHVVDYGLVRRKTLEVLTATAIPSRLPGVADSV